MRFKLIKNNKGSALFMTIMMLAAILTISLGATNIVIPGLVMARTQNFSTNAFFAAEAGAERTLWETRNKIPQLDLLNDIGTSSPSLFYQLLSNGASYNVSFATSGPDIVVTSRGDFQGTRRTIEVEFAPN